MIRKTLAASGAALLVSMMAAAMAADQKNDPYIWLEEIQGEDALDWVREQNAKGEAALKADPRFDGMLADAKAILTSKA
ncbi:MAG: S9 family peptidase, partial [Parvularculaceae bacterium]